MNVFFLTSENENKRTLWLFYWLYLLSISYILQKKKSEKISHCHFEKIGHTLYSRTKTRRSSLFVKLGIYGYLLMWQIVQIKSRSLYFIFRILKSKFWLKSKKKQNKVYNYFLLSFALKHNKEKLHK